MFGDSRNFLKAEPCARAGRRQEGEGPPSAIAAAVPAGQLGSLGVPIPHAPESMWVDLSLQVLWAMRVGVEKNSRGEAESLYLSLLSVPDSGIWAITHLSLGREFRIK